MPGAPFGPLTPSGRLSNERWRPASRRFASSAPLLGDAGIGGDGAVALELVQDHRRQHLAEIHDQRREVLEVLEREIREPLVVHRERRRVQHLVTRGGEVQRREIVAHHP
jgi:hypothetical protein